jgi:hypothetical protein
MIRFILSVPFAAVLMFLAVAVWLQDTPLPIIVRP